VEVNANGQIIRVLDTVKAEPGQNLYLTIDHDLQMTAERLLEGNAGSVVAVDPNNGEILVMASSPTFDPNLFGVGMSRDNWQNLISNPFRPLENKAIQAVYPPASTYKIVTTMAGLEEGVITPETTFFCPGFYHYGNRTYRCWKRWGHGEVSVLQALAQSCDVFYYQVGEALGVDRLAWYAKASGLGERTGVGLDGEESGLIPTAAWKLKRVGTPWQGGETLSVAIGQGFNLVTPLQMAMFMAAVGNGGYRYKPELVHARQSVEGGKSLVSKPKVVGRLPMKKETMAIVHQGLWQVVNDPKGTAWGSHLKELQFSGKTGTAQVVGRREEGGEESGSGSTILDSTVGWVKRSEPTST
jgi:penicillin-binding protein 2